VIAVLSDYPLDIVRRVVDPRSGLPSQSKWLPTVAEIKAALEQEMLPIRREEDRQERERLYRAQLPPPDDRSQRPSYDELRAKHGPNWGITDPGRPKRTDWREAAAAAVKSQVSAEEWAKIPNAPGPRK